MDRLFCLATELCLYGGDCPAAITAEELKKYPNLEVDAHAINRWCYEPRVFTPSPEEEEGK